MSDPRHISKADRSRWAITRERFQLADLSPPAPYRVTTIDKVVPNLMKKIGLEQPMWERTVLQEWAELVGPQVSAHTRPGRLSYGHLIIYVDHSTWLHSLRGNAEKLMLEKLQQRFGRAKIKGLRLELDPDGPAPAPKPKRTSSSEHSKNDGPF